MRFAAALALVVGMILGGIASVGPAIIPTAHVQAQEATSGTRDAPRLAEDEFERLYDRMTGIWMRQSDKSTTTRGDPTDRMYVTYAADGDKAINYTNRRFLPDGQVMTTDSRQVLNGQHYPIPSGERSIARLPLDEFTIETTSKTAAGRQTSRNTQFFSADGQRMSVIGRSVDEDGERITGISVFDKVERIDE